MLSLYVIEETRHFVSLPSFQSVVETFFPRECQLLMLGNKPLQKLVVQNNNHFIMLMTSVGQEFR